MATPLLESRPLAEAFKVKKVYLKLDNCRPTGSFKDRGMQLLCSKLKDDGVKRIVCSSGGNAGLAAAFAGRKLGLAVNIIVPETTSEMMINRIRSEEAEVEVYGSEWSVADEKAREFVKADENAAYVPPFDHELLWEGHSTMIDEIYTQLNGIAPDVMVASVGGGGLLAGVLHGLSKRQSWAEKTMVVAAETCGAASMNEAMKAGKPVHIGSIKTIASSLGAPQVCDGVVKKALAHPAGTKCVVVSDKEALDGCLLLLNEHRFLCEPACGTAIAACQNLDHLNENSVVVIIVCGGGNVSFDLLQKYMEIVN